MSESLEIISLALTIVIIYLLLRKPRTKKVVLGIVVISGVLALLDAVLGHFILSLMWLVGSFLWYLGYEKMGKKEKGDE